MLTVVLDAYSKGYPSITNRIRASVYLQSDPQAFVASLIDSTLGHPARTWSFPGLPRNNYGFSLDEIDVSNNVVNNLALFSVVPSKVDGQLVRDDEQIQVGLTHGLVASANTFVFDGTETFLGSGVLKPNYVGWNIVPSELTGRGILAKGTDYSWNPSTGAFALLLAGDIFPSGLVYNIRFMCRSTTQGNSHPTLSDFGILLVTGNYSATQSDFGKKIIAEPSGMYMEITLPNISTVVQGRPLMIEVGGASVSCLKILLVGSEPIKFIGGTVYAIPNESFSIYKFTRSAGVHEWRIDKADGNFKRVGENVSDDSIQTEVFNKQLLDGSAKNKLQYARIYNQFVLNLPIGQVCNYDDWETGNNKYKYSLSNSANPLFANLFHFPDRRGLFEKNNLSGSAGNYSADTLKSHNHYIKTGGDNQMDDGAGINGYIQGRNNPDNRVNPSDMNSPVTWNMPNHFTTSAGGSETSPRNYLINKYVLI